MHCIAAPMTREEAKAIISNLVERFKEHQKEYSYSRA
jgi:hypothetical protein